MDVAYVLTDVYVSLATYNHTVNRFLENIFYIFYVTVTSDNRKR